MKTSKAETVLLMRAAGATFKEIGKEIGRSGTQARIIFMKATAILEDKSWSAGLSVRTKNCLSRLGVLSRAHAERLFLDGEIQPNKVAGNHIKIRGFGKRCYLELSMWLGINPPTQPTRCRHCGALITAQRERIK